MLNLLNRVSKHRRFREYYEGIEYLLVKRKDCNQEFLNELNFFSVTFTDDETEYSYLMISEPEVDALLFARANTSKDNLVKKLEELNLIVERK